MARRICKSIRIGGKGGSPWDDDPTGQDPKIVGVKSISISHGNQVNGIYVTYATADGAYGACRHGGSVGTEGAYKDTSNFELSDGEAIIRVEGKTSHNIVDQLTFVVRRPDGSEYKRGPYGKTGNTDFKFEGYIVAFFGNRGNLLDSIGVYYMPMLKKSHTFGGSSESSAMSVDTFQKHMPPVIGISKLCIYGNGSEDEVCGIQAEYKLLGGGNWIESYGSVSATPIELHFQDEELIVEIFGKINQDHLSQLNFTTRKTSDGSTKLYGPYGPGGSDHKHFEVEGLLVGFHGSSADSLKLGVFYL